MIDIHSHILPGMDDGSDSPETSRALLSALRAQGVEAVAATPHFYATQDNPGDFLRRRAEAVARMEYDPSDAPAVFLGAEVAYFEGMIRSKDLEEFTLGESSLLLVEMPFSGWSQRMVNEICQVPMQTGLTPVLAHVERYRRADQMPKYMQQLLDGGILFQCNAGAFLTFSERRWALGLLKRRELHFLGSDTHNLTTRPPRLGEAASIITRKLGGDVLDALTEKAKVRLNLEF